jgi:uncharacterized membrane protein
MMRYGYGLHHGVHWLAWLVLALVIAALVVGVVALLRLRQHPAAGAHAGPPSGPDPALNELRIRYARGDITWDEYAQRAANLGYPVPPGTGPAPPPAS